MRGKLPATQYRQVLMGLLFLRYVSDAFENRYRELKAEGYGDEEDRDAYMEKNIFFVPKSARWAKIAAVAHEANNGETIDNAMIAIERENKTLKGVLPKFYGSSDINKRMLGDVIDLFTNELPLGDVEANRDILGRTYEYCIQHFAEYEGKKGGEYYTPETIVRILVEVLQPAAAPSAQPTRERLLAEQSDQFLVPLEVERHLEDVRLEHGDPVRLGASVAAPLRVLELFRVDHGLADRDEQPVFGVKLPDLLRDEREYSLREFRPQTEESFAPASASIVGIPCFHANGIVYNWRKSSIK